MNGNPPRATYRLQLNRDFTFDQAAAIVDYLERLGVSHVYTSPYLKARAGSPHGYDIVDHSALNPEIGDEAAFLRLDEALRRHGMGQILDIVPNHMGVGGCDNAWWLDVLEHGAASAYAAYFDIDWHPPDPALRNKLLLPFLGDHYGRVLERGELRLVFDVEAGGFHVEYYEHCFPIDPRTYPAILAPRGRSEAIQGLDDDASACLLQLVRDFAGLPPRSGTDPLVCAARHETARAARRALARACADHPPIAARIREHLALFEGRPGDERSFDRLHGLLEGQAYRLAFWKVATDQINYRRFFDINELAGLRMENPEVFRATHGLIGRLVRERRVDGLRIDHPDGLADPRRYFFDLQRLVGSSDRRVYVLVEKILASWERLPADWPVAGTTGYDFAGPLNGLFIWPGAERRLNRLYRRFTGLGSDFDDLLYERKKVIMRSTLSGELTVLANLLHRVARAERHTRDFTYHGLAHAITEAVACFPVYRTYVTPDSISPEDERYVHWAIARARKTSPGTDTVIFEFLHDALLIRHRERYEPPVQEELIQFAMRFQQYTAPVMAKGMEDTAFYIYNRLVSLNEVGSDPRTFSASPAAFHHQNRQRLADWPDAMIAVSTHDSKRSGDVRARIDVISEVAEEWQRRLGRWSRLNRMRKLLVDEKYAPSRNDEYLLYQTLVGTWPLGGTPRGDALDSYRGRIQAYMLKAVREAKVHTSWVNTDEAYEEALHHFIDALLSDPDHNAFLADFQSFLATVVRPGLLNALSQTLLRLTSPGVPDTYQGSELWTFTLVDPDNRRPVDYALRRDLLDGLAARTGAADLPGLARELLASMEDGRIKLWLTWRALGVRRDDPELFRAGDYQPLDAEGEHADHVCAFARRADERVVVCAVARWFARLAAATGADPPLGEAWGDTRIAAPPLPDARYRDVLSGTEVLPTGSADGPWFSAATLFAELPFALLVREA